LFPTKQGGFVMPGILGLSSLLLWFGLMFWLYNNSPQWFFIPFFVAATFFYLRMMEAKSS
jgi:hypothetical protein